MNRLPEICNSPSNKSKLTINTDYNIIKVSPATASKLFDLGLDSPEVRDILRTVGEMAAAEWREGRLIEEV